MKAAGTRRGGSGRGWAAELLTPRGLPIVALALAVVVSGILLISYDSQLTFIADDWMLLVKRHGWSADYFLHPFHGNVVIGPAFVYKLLQETFGMGSATPYYCVAIATFLASAVLLFVYLRRRVGDWLALFAAVLILFLGAAFEDLLFAFQIGYFTAAAAGLGALIALDREDDRGDAIACALLSVSVVFSSVGLAFVAGAVVDLALGRRPRARRSYIALVPIGLYVLWWLGWGHVAGQHVSGHNILTTPEFVFKAASAGIVSLLGLATGDGSEPSQPHLIWGEILFVIGLLAIAARIVKDGKVSRGLGIALAIGFTFWVLAGVNRDVSRLPTSSRFQYPSAIFVLLITAELLRGIRLPRPVVVAAAAGTVLAAIAGMSLLQREHEERWAPYADSLHSSLAAVEIAGDSANPQFPVFFPPDIEAPARWYLSSAREFGSPAFSEAQLEARPATERASADLTIAQALGLALGPPRPGDRTLNCQTLQASAAGYTGITLLRGGFKLTNRAGQPIEVLLSRFADELSVDLGPVPAGATTFLQIPPDNGRRAWSLGLSGEGPVRLCTTEAA
ncbi:MAG TPA: hypothetical protein VFX45_08810 [Solirubrobacterales bacterium]|nr:hypothetical protein [Solirubrobacterales bacterium]